MSEQTVRGLVQDIQVEMRDGDLQPQRAADLLSRATGLLGNVLTEIRGAEADYNVVLLEKLDGDEAANRATIRAKTTPQYQRMREAEDTKEFLMESVRSLRKIADVLTAEMRLTR